VSAAIAVKVDPGNTEQAKAWDGNEGAYWATNAEYFDRSVAGYGAPFMAAADISEHDHVLDVGCGTGQTTRDAARVASSGSALGVDLSARMIAYAGQIAAREGPPNASFEQADAQVHPFKAEIFDVAISRTGAMFFADPVAAFTNIARSLRRGGRLALLTWQEPNANEWIRELSTAMAAGRDLPTPPPDAPGPFSLSDLNGSRPFSAPQDSPTSSSNLTARGCGSARMPTTRSGSCSASAGCSRASTMTVSGALSTTWQLPSPPTTPATASSTGRQPGSSKHQGATDERFRRHP
jgi:SAM-dependent methyltransferase